MVLVPGGAAQQSVRSLDVAEDSAARRLSVRPDQLRSAPTLVADGRSALLERSTRSLSVSLLVVDAGNRVTAVVRVRGEVDLASAPALRDVLQPILEHESGPVVVDLSEVSFMDLTGVHVLVAALSQLEPQNRRLAIACREQGPVHRLLALVGLLSTLEVHGSRRSAVTGGDELIRFAPDGNP